jgi:hypothetical protein
MTSLITRSLIASGMVVVSVAFVGGAAQAATVHKPTRVAHAQHVVHIKRVARVEPNDPVGQFLQFFFGGDQWRGNQWRYAGGAANRRGTNSGSSGSSSGDMIESPTYDTSSPSASDDAAAAIQSANDEAALNASTAAAEQQNEAAQAAAIQTEINAGN